MSGLGAPRFTATPMPAFMMSARVSATSLPALIRSSVWKSTSTARSNGSPPSIRRFITAATSVTTTGLKPVACSKPGPTSAIIILVTREPKILSSADVAALDCTATISSANAIRTSGRLRCPGMTPPDSFLLFRQREPDGKDDRQDHHRGLRFGELAGDDLRQRVGDEAEPDAGGNRVGERHGDRRHQRRSVVRDVDAVHIGHYCHHTRR